MSLNSENVRISFFLNEILLDNGIYDERSEM